MIKFTVIRKTNLFAQRFISASVPDRSGNLIVLSGKPDRMLASGFRSPETPFFCFQEYKREKDPNGDPAGQCLAAMMVGQTLNGHTDQPVYGCCVIGENWRFIVMTGKKIRDQPSFFGHYRRSLFCYRRFKATPASNL